MEIMKGQLNLFNIVKPPKYTIKTNTIFQKITVSQIMMVSLSLIMMYYIIKHYLYYTIAIDSLVPTAVREGFSGVGSEKSMLVLKKNNNLFDDFYANIYDKLMYNDVKNSFELGKLSHHTDIDEHSKILDIGCGTGHHIAHLLGTNKNISSENIIGIDVSKHMIAKSQEYYPEHKDVYHVADAMNSSLFRDNTFSHILCLYFTIYYIKDKYRMFKNCHNWLQSGGILLLHLVDPDDFDPMVQAANPLEIINVQNYSDERITDSKVVFNGFDYTSKFTYNNSQNLGKFTEKFMFKNGKVRQNEHTLYMEDRDTIVNIAESCGFIIKEIIHMHKCGYEHQYLYILEKHI